MYPALDKCVMLALMCLRCLCHNDDTGISTRNKSPSLSVTYNGYNECTFVPRASKRFPLWSIHPPKEKPTRMPSSSSSGSYKMLCSTNVEPCRSFRSTVLIPIIAQCCEFLTRTELECWDEYYRNWDL